MVEKQPAFARINLQISVLLYHVLLFSPSCISNFHLQCLIFKTDRISKFFSDFVWATFALTCTLFVKCSHSCNENCVHFVLVFVVLATLSACPVISGSTGQTQHTYMQIAVNTKCVYTHTYCTQHTSNYWNAGLSQCDLSNPHLIMQTASATRHSNILWEKCMWK